MCFSLSASRPKKQPSWRCGPTSWRACDLEERGWTQTEAAERLSIGQSRVSDLVRGKRDKFSLDMLITLATRAGFKIELQLAA